MTVQNISNCKGDISNCKGDKCGVYPHFSIYERKVSTLKTDGEAQVYCIQSILWKLKKFAYNL